MNRAIKNKARPSTPQRDSLLRASGPGQEGGGPQNYDGRANTAAGTPPPMPEASAFEGPGFRVAGEE